LGLGVVVAIVVVEGGLGLDLLGLGVVVVVVVAERGLGLDLLGSWGCCCCGRG
jgi:hypothetical protein